MKSVGKALDMLERIIRVICGVLVAGFSALTLIQVIMRYVFSAPIWWSEQACRYMFIWMLMLYVPLIVRHGQNLGFDLLVNRLNEKAQSVMLLICEILIGAFGGFFCVYSIQLCQRFSGRFMDGLHVPASFMYGSEAVCGGLILLFSLEVVINHICKLAKNGKENK